MEINVRSRSPRVGIELFLVPSAIASRDIKRIRTRFFCGKRCQINPRVIIRKRYGDIVAFYLRFCHRNGCREYAIVVIGNGKRVFACGQSKSREVRRTGISILQRNRIVGVVSCVYKRNVDEVSYQVEVRRCGHASHINFHIVACGEFHRFTTCKGGIVCGEREARRFVFVNRFGVRVYSFAYYLHRLEGVNGRSSVRRLLPRFRIFVKFQRDVFLRVFACIVGVAVRLYCECGKREIIVVHKRYGRFKQVYVNNKSIVRLRFVDNQVRERERIGIRICVVLRAVIRSCRILRHFVQRSKDCFCAVAVGKRGYCIVVTA